MGRKSKYATEEERKAAKNEQAKKRMAKLRAKKAAEQGREPKIRKQYDTEEERKTAKIKAQRKAEENRGEKREATRKTWEPVFVGLDGESFITGEKLATGEDIQDYTLLLRNDKAEFFNRNGLSTEKMLWYLTSKTTKGAAYVGYFLNFDFEWILKDLPIDEYKALQKGELIAPADFDDFFLLQWFTGKSLEIYRLKDSSFLKPKNERTMKDYWKVKFQDVSGFFQTSFVKALKKWGFADDLRLKKIIDGKAARGAFDYADLATVKEYNALEMELLEELMQEVYKSFEAAYKKAELKFRPNSTTWTGPGWFANDFLKQTAFNEEHEPPPAEQVAHFSEEYQAYFGNEVALYYPFSLSYFGGRIELGAIGRFQGGYKGRACYNYDINSAYPYALSLLPKWTADDFRVYMDIGQVNSPAARDFLSRRLMGMYGVRFEFPKGWSWYPFPVRSTDEGSPNVFYPRQGFTHVMSPELFAVLDTLTPEELKHVTIEYGYVLEGTDGYGDALARMPEERLSQTAIKTLTMADVRLECKAASKRLNTLAEQPEDKILAMAEKALKLILNSLYGKTVQQVGAHKHYNDFVSSWITSVCRALLWRAISTERKTENVLMTMTDGVYSRVPLSFAAERTTNRLGDWEEEEFSYFETFKPGVYRYEGKDGMHYKVRGFMTPTEKDSERLFELIWRAATVGEIGKFPARQFITRNLAQREDWSRFPYVRQFKEEQKDIKSELRAKRSPNKGSWLIPEGKTHVFFYPKREFSINDSVGYSLDFENPMRLPDEEKDIEDFQEKYESVIGLEELV